MWPPRKRFRALEIYQLVFNLGAASILLVRGGSAACFAVNAALLALLVFVVPRLSGAPGWRGHLGDVYFLPAFMFYYLETDVLHRALYGDFLVDGWLWRADAALFGVQPSSSFVAALPMSWAGELLSFGYLSFYPLAILAGMSRLLGLTRREDYDSLVSSIAITFVSCYVIFVLVPTAGPRYAFADSAAEVNGFVVAPFLRHMLAAGERPTGAFPSSHVAFVVILASWAWRFRRRFFWIMLPLAAVLSLGTVYIQAHYAVDAIAGLLYGLLMARLAQPVRLGAERLAEKSGAPWTGVPQVSRAMRAQN